VTAPVARLAGAALALGAVVALAGCAATPAPDPTRTASAPGGGSSPRVPPTPAPDAASVGFTCAEALPAVPSQYTAATADAPAAGTVRAQAVQLGGIACASTLADGAAVTFSVAQPPAGQLTSLQQAAASSETTTTALGGQQGYFGTAAGVGSAQVFAGGYWITVQSTAFTAEADAAPVVMQIINVLPGG
jgi:hypothetical protein